MSVAKAYPPRKIGDAQVSALGYGAMAIGGLGYGTPGPDEERFKLLDRLIELGCTNWDTASIYGDSEELLGKYFARNPSARAKVFLATKFGFTPERGVRGDPEFVHEQIAISLKRLQTDHVDLYYQHRPDGNVPIEVTVGAMAELVKQGKVKYLGLSEASPDTIRRAHKVHPIAAIQVEYSPFELTLEKPGGVIDVARELGIAIVAYSPTGRGMATGRYRSIDDLPADDFRRSIPKYSAKNFPRINRLVDELQAVGAKHNATAAQVTIAWLLAQGKDVIPIPGSKQIKYTEENWSALDINLSEEEVKEIRELCEGVERDLGKDTRYAAQMMEGIYKETPPLDSWKGKA